MIRRTAWIAAASLTLVGPVEGGEGPAGDVLAFQSAFERDGVRFSIAGKARRVTLAYADGELACYTVRMDGRFVHPERDDGGRLIGCRYADLTVSVRPFPDDGRPLGWAVETGSICGNTHSRRVTLVTVPRRYGRFADRYVETTFDCKVTPTFRRTEQGVEVWGGEQDWGRGGTSSSIFVPFVWLVPPDAPPRRAALPDDWTLWHEDLTEPHFLSVYVAGRNEGNAGLMRSALRLLYRGDNETWCSAFGLPADRSRLEQAADAVERASAARADLERLLDPTR